MKTRDNAISGSLKVSTDVLIRIAELAAMEIPGVSVKQGHLDTNDIQLLVANRLVNPIKASLKGDTAELTVSIIVIQGNKAIKVAEAVQQSVKSAVQNMTGIAVSKVNVRIVGVKMPDLSALAE